MQRVCPVMNPASSESRNSIAGATSLDCPTLIGTKIAAYIFEVFLRIELLISASSAPYNKKPALDGFWRLAPGYPPVRALHGASLRVQTRAKQLARSAPKK